MKIKDTKIFHLVSKITFYSLGLFPCLILGGFYLFLLVCGFAILIPSVLFLVLLTWVCRMIRRAFSFVAPRLSSVLGRVGN